MTYILTSDWHIRADTPVCRDDDFMQVQQNILNWIAELAKRHNARVLIAGDLFHVARPDRSQELEIMLQRFFRDVQSQWIAGNHDLLWKRSEYKDRSSIGVLEYLNNSFDGVVGYDFDTVPEIVESAEIVMLHEYTDVEKNEFIETVTAQEWLDKFPDAELIVTGDNHKSFVYEEGGRFVVNPGALTKQTTDYIGRECYVYLYNSDSGNIEKLVVPDSGVISDKHIVDSNERSERIQAFVEQLKGGVDIDMSFKSNVEQYCASNKVSESVHSIIQEVLS